MIPVGLTRDVYTMLYTYLWFNICKICLIQDAFSFNSLKTVKTIHKYKFAVSE